MMKPEFTSVIKWIGTPASLVIHTLFFAGMLVLGLFGISMQNILLILTTIVSLEAIYLSIFIQMSINEHTKHLEAVKDTVSTLQETVDDVQETIDDVQETVDDVQETVDENNDI